MIIEHALNRFFSAGAKYFTDSLMNQFDGRKDFLKMVQNYLDGTATPEEIQLLEAYYESLDKNPGILNQYTDQQKEDLGSEMEAFLLNRMAASETRILPLWKKPWFTAAAASVLIFLTLGTGFFLVNKRKQETALKQITTPLDFTPGEDKAILTLADGSSIILDSASNGHIADQGKVAISKSADGQLVYGHQDKNIQDEQPAQMNMVSTPAGGQYRIVLPDGSKVWLNAKSSLRFPTFFAGSDRKVSISGECYFEIAKDRRKPFIIDVSGKQEILVTGTHFNVNSYKDEAAIKTTLLEGSVNVRNLTKPGKLTLKPGDQSVMASDGNFHVSQVDVDEVVAWKNGLFQFQKTSLEMVMRQVSRWYNVEVTYETNTPRKTFSGKIHRNANASQMLEILKFAGVNFRMEATEKEGLTGRIVVLP